MPINYEMLHELSLSRPGARELFDAILEAGVEDECTTVDELIERSDATRRDAITFLRDLDAAGCGEFKVGRKGHPSRLMWSVDPSEIARQAISGEMAGAAPQDEQGLEPEPYAQDLLDASGVGVDESAPAPATRATLDLDESTLTRARKSTRRARSAKRDRASAELIEHSFVLRPDNRVSVALPADLTRREAEVLGDWIRNLSFER